MQPFLKKMTTKGTTKGHSHMTYNIHVSRRKGDFNTAMFTFRNLA